MSMADDSVSGKSALLQARLRTPILLPDDRGESVSLLPLDVPPYDVWQFRRSAEMHIGGGVGIMAAALCLMIAQSDWTHAPVVILLSTALIIGRICLGMMRDQPLAQRIFMRAWVGSLFFAACSTAMQLVARSSTPVQLVGLMSGNLLITPATAFASTVTPIPRWHFMAYLASLLPAHWVLLQEMLALEAVLGDAWRGLGGSTLALFVLEYAVSIVLFVWLDRQTRALHRQLVEAELLGQSRERCARQGPKPQPPGPAPALVPAHSHGRPLQVHRVALARLRHADRGGADRAAAALRQRGSRRGAERRGALHTIAPRALNAISRAPAPTLTFFFLPSGTFFPSWEAHHVFVLKESS
jgi:hypothetical protein